MKGKDSINWKEAIVKWIVVIIVCVIGLTFAGCNVGVKKELETNLNTINVLWQDGSRWDSETAKGVANINPDKFIVNVDGPYSDSTNPHCGPHAKDLIGFIDTLVNIHKYPGKLVMHPDCNWEEFVHDWSNGVKWDSISDGWTLYIDYFVLLNDSLEANNLPIFSELLIETGNSYMKEKADIQDSLFNMFGKYLNSKTTHYIVLSATIDWQANWATWRGVDYYYAQMYDVCYADSTGGIWDLCGPNPYSLPRCDTLAYQFNKHIKLLNQDSVSFIFTYAPSKPVNTHTNPPMFGEDSLYWSRSNYDDFIKSFRSNKGLSNSSVGIWHCESPLSKW